MMFFIPYIGNDTLRIVYAAISGLIMILGYVSVPTVLNSLVRSNIPKGKEGTFMGIRMIFVVALPMCIGPFIGDALNKAYGENYVGDYGVESPLPSNYGYLVSLFILVIAIILIIFVLIKGRKENRNVK